MWKRLKVVTESLEKLTEKVRDTFMGVGSETLSEARVYYHSVKGAAKADVPGAETVARELGKTYRLGPRKEEEKDKENEE